LSTALAPPLRNRDCPVGGQLRVWRLADAPKKKRGKEKKKTTARPTAYTSPEWPGSDQRRDPRRSSPLTGLPECRVHPASKRLSTPQKPPLHRMLCDATSRCRTDPGTRSPWPLGDLDARWFGPTLPGSSSPVHVQGQGAVRSKSGPAWMQRKAESLPGSPAANFLGLDDARFRRPDPLYTIGRLNVSNVTRPALEPAERALFHRADGAVGGGGS